MLVKWKLTQFICFIVVMRGSKMCYSSGKEGNLYFIVLKCVIVVKENAFDTQFVFPSYFALKKQTILVPVMLVIAHCSI